MNKAYHFRVGPMGFILSIQYSTIGYGYPRIFVAFPDNSYINCDFTLNKMFPMTEDAWFSWYGDELIEVDDIEIIRKKVPSKRDQLG